MTEYLGGYERRRVEQQLASEAAILLGELVRVPPAQLPAWAADAARRAGASIAIRDPAGATLAQSGGASEISHSAVFDYQGRPQFVLQIGVPGGELKDAVAAVRFRILIASAIAALAALGFATFATRSVTRRVRRLQQFAESLPAGRGAAALEPDGNDEIGALAASLSRMAAKLEEVVDQLSLESARSEAILSSMVEGVLAVDGNLRVTFCNESFARAVGARAPVPELLPVLELVRDPAFLDMLSRVLVTGETLKQRLELAAADGRSFEVQCAPLAVASRLGAIAILHDITDLERLERVRRDFVGNVSHELRTPLTAIRGYAETLLDGAIDDQENNRNFLEKIRAGAIRLNNIAADLLALSELESGREPAGREPVPVLAAVEAALRTVDSEARLRQVCVRTGRMDAAEVLGHRIRLEQALVNLLHNAVKFNRPGGEVAVEVLRNGAQVKITVGDTGIGIPSEDLPRIFERFYRVDRARSREVGGTGLGLSIVKHAIERMDGSVAVESQLGKGSRFMVTLPLC